MNDVVDSQLKNLTYPNAKKIELMGKDWIAKMMRDLGSTVGGDYTSGDLARTKTKNFTMMKFSDSD
eukprot:COSAG02_NODE_2430_length_8883_cov_3.641621_4_plen_66_part_00